MSAPDQEVKDTILWKINEARSAMMQANPRMSEDNLKLYIPEWMLGWLFRDHRPGNRTQLFGLEVLPGYQKDLIVLSDTLDIENRMVIIKIR